eukprot:CAMPEP_0116881574 /NCGR_PEP_ID=MMETSP0463-20121206/13660_1 /TAXON_ID=181622 /ORGANISM="Strombidinopsis sp, Strain SopsisLIS2011" /LENGTH=164 /DNA_ID=CAMNT_0004533603 /DNA_START=26 /DNA_END=521 /DNA_ORIENTATION=+
MGKQVYKVLMTNLAAGSHLKNEWELAHSLSMKPDFDVTVITSRDFKLEFEEADSLHFIRLESINGQASLQSSNDNLAAGSHLKNEWELAHSLSMKPDFDVTVITSRDFKLEFEEADSLHFIRLESIKESDCNDLFQETGDPLAWTVQWTRLLTKEILYNEEIMT